jgi:transcription antitermination factor NusG
MKKSILEEEFSDEEDQEYTQNDAEKDFVPSDYESSSSENDHGSDEEEEEEEETSEEETRKGKRTKPAKKPKKRSKLNRFIEEEAEEESEEEEEEEEDDEITKQFLAPEGEEAEGTELEEEVGPTASEYRKQFRERFEKEEIDIEAEEDRLRKLYGRVKLFRKRNKTALAAGGEEEEIPQQFLLPTPSDPKLWLVRCKIGKERAIVHQLMRAFVELQNLDTPLQILSCTARDNLKGYIYIEAHKATAVAQAIESAHLIHMVYCGPSGNKCTFVPLEEMPQVINITGRAAVSAALSIPRLGSFVRIKKGLYIGDLGQVVEVPEDEFLGENLRTVRIKLKLVPRLFSSVPGRRPEAKLFDPEEANQHHAVTRSRGFWMYERESFKNGLLFKDFYLSSIQTESVHPKPKEMEMLGEEDHEGTLTEAPEIILNKGDRVIVTEGEFINIIGSVKDINVEESQAAEGDGDNVNILPVVWIKIIPEKKHEIEEIIVESKQLCKYFTTGDRVVLTEEENTPTAIVISFSPANKSLVVFNESLGQIEVDMDKVSTKIVSGTAIAKDDKQSLKELRRLANITEDEERPSQHTQTQKSRFPGPPIRSLLGKSVSIAYGPYKGYMGIVKQIEEQTGNVKVELHTNSRLVSVPRDRIVFKGAMEGNAPIGGEFKHPAKTPAWSSSTSKTPAWSGSTGKTPAWSAKTPTWGAPGGKTPSWRDAEGKTPAWRSTTSKTPSWEPQPVARQSAKTPTWQPAQQASQAPVEIPQPSATPKFVSEGALVLYNDQEYSISSADDTQKPIILKNEAGETTNIDDASLLKPIAPAKRDRAMIFGDGSMLKGTVIGLDGPEAVVKIDGSGEFKIIKASTLVKLK